MTTILRIDASARSSERSLTRRLGDALLEAWRAAAPAVDVIRRDVGAEPPGFIDAAFIGAAFTDHDQRTPEQRALLAASDRLIEEVRQADALIIASPMYNYGMPATLKAWFDQVIRVNETFSFDLARGDRPLEPILSGKTLIMLTSWGEFGFGPGELNDGANHLTPHIRTASRYLGVDQIHHVGVEYQEFGDARHEASKAAAFASLPGLAARLAAAAPKPDHMRLTA